MVSTLTIEFSNHYPRLEFEGKRLKNFFEVIFSLHRHNSSGVLSVVFLEREHHSQIHGEFLNDFRPTDVITFPADETNDMAGEICVSVDQAIEESNRLKVSLQEELSLYLIHGWLHLLGFDDIEDVDRKIMRREESRVMDLIRQSKAWPDFLLASDPSSE